MFIAIMIILSLLGIIQMIASRKKLFKNKQRYTFKSYKNKLL